MKIPRLTEDGDHWCARLYQRAHVAILFHRILGEARGTEGRQLGMLQAQFRGAREELLVFGVGSGPPAFNVVDAKLIQLLRNDELVIHGERDGLALRSIPESGIEREDLHITPDVYFLAATASDSCGTPA